MCYRAHCWYGWCTSSGVEAEMCFERMKEGWERPNSTWQLEKAEQEREGQNEVCLLNTTRQSETLGGTRDSGEPSSIWAAVSTGHKIIQSRCLMWPRVIISTGKKFLLSYKLFCTRERTAVILQEEEVGFFSHFYYKLPYLARKLRFLEMNKNPFWVRR